MGFSASKLDQRQYTGHQSPGGEFQLNTIY